MKRYSGLKQDGSWSVWIAVLLNAVLTVLAMLAIGYWRQHEMKAGSAAAITLVTQNNTNATTVTFRPFGGVMTPLERYQTTRRWELQNLPYATASELAGRVTEAFFLVCGRQDILGDQYAEGNVVISDDRQTLYIEVTVTDCGLWRTPLHPTFLGETK